MGADLAGQYDKDDQTCVWPRGRIPLCTQGVHCCVRALSVNQHVTSKHKDAILSPTSGYQTPYQQISAAPATYMDQIPRSVHLNAGGLIASHSRYWQISAGGTIRYTGQLM